MNKTRRRFARGRRNFRPSAIEFGFFDCFSFRNERRRFIDRTESSKTRGGDRGFAKSPAGSLFAMNLAAIVADTGKPVRADAHDRAPYTA